MKLLSVISTLNPSYGGPVESLRQFEACVGKFGHEHHILTLDSPDCAWVKECAGKVSAVGPSFGMYGFNASVNSWLLANAGKYDAIIVRGIWQYHGFAVRRVAMAMGIPYTAAHGTIRFSFSCYNTMQEVERVIAAVPPIVAQLRKLSPYWGEDGPVEDPGKMFAPTYA